MCHTPMNMAEQAQAPQSKYLNFCPIFTCWKFWWWWYNKWFRQGSQRMVSAMLGGKDPWTPALYLSHSWIRITTTKCKNVISTRMVKFCQLNRNWCLGAGGRCQTKALMESFWLMPHVRFKFSWDNHHHHPFVPRNQKCRQKCRAILSRWKS